MSNLAQLTIEKKTIALVVCLLLAAGGVIAY